MATFPYVHIYCPCADSPIDFKKDEPISNFLDTPADIIDTRDQRMSFSLHPLSNLYFCEECYAIRCPRCVQEETISQFCPNCLFEVPKSSIYSNGNRKGLYICPICFASLSLVELESLKKGHSYSDKDPSSYALECPYCQWTSAEINIIFEKPSGLNAQMKDSLPEISKKKLFYSKLRAHYEETYGTLKLQTNNHSGISKMINIYERIKKKYSLKNKKEVDVFNFYENSRDLEDDQEIIKKMAEMKNLNEIATIKQRLNQLYHVIFKNDLKPIPYLLRAKRSKRCRSCKSILISPESKPMSAKFRIKLIAMNYIPTISLKCFPGPISNCSPGKLSPNVTNLFLLTVTNPLYQKIKVFLATPQRTSGKYSHSVTILCPEFEVGANKDTSNNNSITKSIPKDTTKMPISGALWDRGKNWTTVVLEIIPSEIISNNIDFNDDLVEISIFVKIVYDIILDKEEFKHVETSLSQRIVSKEIGFWGVIGLGKIL
ncbi:hypothetical protein PNEG_01222 [Pneumocystis murina B123]|uniref:Dynactin subunit 4 n=1 Tax=Pneumocystis murina (strain B123) TaxID=1069680 RepID=M7NTS3_PNEMU|nr:hypothetical protein PNEG_01222 [Pneumocystis murina B123]EMR10511.1 hypothetical protein PNEG_01222 [Pneumocystis murina B123]